LNAIYFNYEQEKVNILADNKIIVEEKSLVNVIKELCLINGAELSGFLKASQKLMPNVKILPIFLGYHNIILVPLGSYKDNEGVWLNPEMYLNCYSDDDITYIRFVDKTEIKVKYSIKTINNQFKKYLKFKSKLIEKRLEHEY
jgi:competence transcription factor ComK